GWSSTMATRTARPLLSGARPVERSSPSFTPYPLSILLDRPDPTIASFLTSMRGRCSAGACPRRCLSPAGSGATLCEGHAHGQRGSLADPRDGIDLPAVRGHDLACHEQA